MPQETASTASLKRFLRLTIPNILSNVTVPLTGLADTIMLGHLPDVSILAGVALGAVIFDYVYWTFGFLRMGTTGLTAQAMGRRDQEEVFHLLYRGLLIGGIIGLSILILQYPLMKVAFALLSGSPDVEAAGQAYFSARIWAAPATLCNFAFLGWYLGREESHLALYMTMVANVSNVILNYIFLYLFHLGAFGAGLGTAISQYFQLVIALLIFRSKQPRPQPSRQTLLDRKKLSHMLRLNIDILIRTVCLISAFAIFTNFGAKLGTVVLAANSILLRFLDIAAYFIDGAAFATESLAGIFYGERNRAALRKLLMQALLLGELFALGFIVVIALWPEPIFRGMTSHDNVIALLREYDYWFMLALIFGAVAYIYDGFFIGLTRGRTLRNAMLISFFVGFLPWAILAVRSNNNHGLWASLVVFMVFRDVTLFWPSRKLIEGKE
ncbi:MAG: MATE family efflux transporter [candidate division KSB1 bacterium]|nr:MATE family efflux transporter [candidate division KSB1 bacterium]MDQ7064790.1 MATE family efflux transporter [candidate division KSB1 bacterium]